MADRFGEKSEFCLVDSFFFFNVPVGYCSLSAAYFSLFMAYESNTITGVNLLASAIYRGPVSDARYLLVWISRAI